MMDALPWPAITAGGGGWALLGLCLYGYITGRWWVSRAEMSRLEKRLDKVEGVLEKTVDQNGQLMDMARLGAATMQALNKAATTE